MHVHLTSIAIFFTPHSAVTACVAASRAQAPGATLARSLATDALTKHFSQSEGEMDECQVLQRQRRTSSSLGQVDLQTLTYSLRHTHWLTHACSHTHRHTLLFITLLKLYPPWPFRRWRTASYTHATLPACDPQCRSGKRSRLTCHTFTTNPLSQNTIQRPTQAVNRQCGPRLLLAQVAPASLNSIFDVFFLLPHFFSFFSFQVHLFYSHLQTPRWIRSCCGVLS